MNDEAPRIHHLGDTTQWPDPPPATDVIETPVKEPSSRRTWATAAGLVLVGALVGTVGVTAAQSSSRDTPTSQTAATGQLPGTTAQGQLPGQQVLPQGGDDGGRGGFGGGFDGEQRLQGTITAVSTDSVTVRTTSGTATYAVSSATEIRRNGADATLADLRVGDAVLVHVYPVGGSMAAERVLAGTSATDRGFGGPPPDGTAPNGTAPDGGTVGRNT